MYGTSINPDKVVPESINQTAFDAKKGQLNYFNHQKPLVFS